MPSWEIVVLSLIPVYCLAYFLLFSPLVSWLSRRGCAGRCARTEETLKGGKFGYAIYVCGHQGAGTTTMMSGLGNMFSKIKSESVRARMTEIQLLLDDVDFGPVDAVVHDAFFRCRVTNTDAILSSLRESFPELMARMHDEFVDDGLYPYNKMFYLRQYVDCLLAVFRDNYNYYYSRQFYCWVNGRWAMSFDPGMIEIKDRHLSGDYRVQKWTNILDDEKTTYKGNLDYQEQYRRDSGGDLFLRFIRHLGMETVHYFTTAQDFGRVVANERELGTSIFYVLDRKEVSCFSLSRVFLLVAYDFLDRWRIFLESFVDSFRKAEGERIGRETEMLSRFGLPPVPASSEKARRLSGSYGARARRIRSVLGRMDRRLRRERADGYVRYRGRWYSNADDVGKETAGKALCSPMGEFDFVFPVRWCYGSVNTWYFSDLGDYLSLESMGCADFYDPSERGVPEESYAAFERRMEFLLRKSGKAQARQQPRPRDETFVDDEA